MAMLGSTGSADSIGEINMTPMIDVLLVLLVIFMLAQPTNEMALDIQLPEPDPQEATATVPPIVLELDASGVLRLNTALVPNDQIAVRLRQVYEGRNDRVLFVKADGSRLYQEIVQLMDIAKGAGVEVLGVALPND